MSNYTNRFTVSAADSQIIREALNYDPNTGIFKWAKRPSHHFESSAVAARWNGRYSGNVIKYQTQGYIRLKIVGKLYAAHRVAYFLSHGYWPNGDVDHINRIKSDNRIANLRDVDNKTNAHNRVEPNRNSTTGYLGVGWSARSRKWVARLNINGRLRIIGSFKSPELASSAYFAAKNKIYPMVLP